jgi:hypothetical protein
MHNTHNNGKMNHNYGRLQDLILLFKFLMGMGRNFFNFKDKLGTCPQKVCQPCILIYGKYKIECYKTSVFTK